MYNPDPKRRGEWILLRISGSDDEKYYRDEAGILQKEWQLFYKAVKVGDEFQFDPRDSKKYYICRHKDEFTNFICNHSVRYDGQFEHRPHNDNSGDMSHSLFSPNAIYRKRSKLYLYPNLRYYFISNIVWNRLSFRKVKEKGKKCE